MRCPLVLVFLALLPSLLCGCASAPAKQDPKAREAHVHLSPEAKAQLERRLAEKARHNEEIFEVFSRKSDEYQNLRGVCQDLSDKEQNQALKETCSARLRDLRLQLAELKARLEEE